MIEIRGICLANPVGNRNPRSTTIPRLLMKPFLTFAAPLVFGISGLLSHEASAAPIVGEISFSGSYTIDNTNLSLATMFLSFSNVTVSSGPTGDYLGLDGAAVTHSAFTFDPLPVVGVVPLWTIPSFPGTSFD